MAGNEFVMMRRTGDRAAPSSLGGRLRILGPGLVLAATTVGVGDLVSSLVAGERFGTAFIWAIILAAILKYFMTEALGRWHLASGDTIIGGWDSIGRWATAFVTIYLLFWAFTYGAAGPSVVGLAANAAFPALPREAWAIMHSLLAFAVVWLGRYHLFETIMKVLIGAKTMGSAQSHASGLGAEVDPPLSLLSNDFADA